MHPISTRPRRPYDTSRVAMVLVGAAVAVLMALLLTDGGAPVAVAALAAAAGFGAFIGAVQMLRGA